MQFPIFSANTCSFSPTCPPAVSLPTLLIALPLFLLIDHQSLQVLTVTAVSLNFCVIYIPFLHMKFDRQRASYHEARQQQYLGLFVCLQPHSSLCAYTCDEACGTLLFLRFVPDTYANSLVSNAIFRVSNNFPPVLSKFATIN